MVKFEYSNGPHHCDPPGCIEESVNEGSTKVAVIPHHRFAMFYWNKWRNKKGRSHDVYTLDYHHDLCPIDFEDELRQLDTTNDEEVAKFIWARMRVLNDTHPKTAMFLDIISDFHVFCRQDYNGSLQLVDKDNKTHTISIYHEMTLFERAIQPSDRMILDIDLDYFVENYNSEKPVRLAQKQKIRTTIEFIKDYWSKIEGITIATEPRHCGGIINSYKVLKTILDYLRDG